MRRDLNPKHTIIWTARYPSRARRSRKRFCALVGVGGNIGNVKRAFDRLFARLLNDGAIDIVKTSPLLKNPDFAASDTPPYLNAVMLIKTNLPPFALLGRLRSVENRFGRTRPYKNAPRTIDLDMIFFETKRSYNPKLLLPHPKWSERISAVLPTLLLQGTI
ncbi:MAG: 2-amino-4-hydroxy-6-hydroxymethyldihydropteridine diphosphokinase [Helicobacteraceae bacterium]|jgi:2-amino-4-hydroxy-6-hydroxymethyldihydropteridine diphosphokinase|nr:2-amino-4-hydroxy-6-hydroxymethyldihydropteridine diphosphokinase [Helicobacteraceae bacterium]